MEENNDLTLNPTVDTLAENQTALDGNDQHAENSNVTNIEEDSSLGEDQYDANKEAEELKRKLGKAATVEKENAKLKKDLAELQSYKQTVDILNDALGEDEETYEKVAVKLRKKHPDKYIPDYKTAYGVAVKEAQAESNPQNKSIDQLVEEKLNQREESSKERDAIASFIEEHQDFQRTENDDEVSIAAKTEKFSEIANQAYFLMKSYPGIYDYKKAYSKAYKMLNVDTLVQKADEVDNLAEQAVGNGQNVTTGAGVVTGGSTSTSTGAARILDARDKAFCKKHNISETAYLKIKFKEN